jgi:hypothetical protein
MKQCAGLGTERCQDNSWGRHAAQGRPGPELTRSLAGAPPPAELVAASAPEGPRGWEAAGAAPAATEAPVPRWAAAAAAAGAPDAGSREALARCEALAAAAAAAGPEDTGDMPQRPCRFATGAPAAGARDLTGGRGAAAAAAAKGAGGGAAAAGTAVAAR